MERWRKPAVPLEISQDVESAWWDGTRWYGGTNATYGTEDHERFRAGRLCFGHSGLCAEPFETPFPETCSVCGYEVRENQARDYAIEFQGEKHIGPSTSMRQEMDRLNDWADREYHTTRSGIVVPRRAG
jgi:hypothetical protein